MLQDWHIPARSVPTNPDFYPSRSCFVSLPFSATSWFSFWFPSLSTLQSHPWLVLLSDVLSSSLKMTFCFPFWPCVIFSFSFWRTQPARENTFNWLPWDNTKLKVSFLHLRVTCYVIYSDIKYRIRIIIQLYIQICNGLHNYYKSTRKDFCNFLVRIIAAHSQRLRKMKSGVFIRNANVKLYDVTFMMAIEFKFKFKCQHTLH